MSAWINPEIDEFLVSSRESRKQLIKSSIPREKIRSIKFPIRNSLRKNEIIEDKKILIVYCARKGSGYFANDVKKIYPDNQIKLVFICGQFGAVLYFECIHKGVIPLIGIRRNIIKHEAALFKDICCKGLGYIIHDSKNLKKVIEKLTDYSIYNQGLKQLCFKPFSVFIGLSKHIYMFPNEQGGTKARNSVGFAK
ncbi:hypothetical protein CS063_09180 [Sporanaerobium hydrogeniformans]|uniref:Uncharacterized protein n=1 Tax=Sporanaerobium hydrogeniformans TaxID=3072179 RepID=A0AC61DD67_9FIRM|nr:hypothetical protein [Sporanaerobium hydrogeniformans]PHV70693.1 hypothetical protein CS063_09180 [Sporanaerobium hydrogeniformans]